jgi:aconitate hydratase
LWAESAHKTEALLLTGKCQQGADLRAPRYLGLRTVIALSFARIHWQNQANFGVLALEFTDQADYDDIDQGDVIVLDDLRDVLDNGGQLTAVNDRTLATYHLTHHLSARQVAMVLAGGQIPATKQTNRSSDG